MCNSNIKQADSLAAITALITSHALKINNMNLF